MKTPMLSVLCLLNLAKQLYYIEKYFLKHRNCLSYVYIGTYYEVHNVMKYTGLLIVMIELCRVCKQLFLCDEGTSSSAPSFVIVLPF